MKIKAFENFTSPGAEFRGKPFWAWNGRMDPDELRRQIRVMHRMGLGGFFMHSRVGLATPYLSDEWFECVDACIDEAEKCSMEAWLYDEDRWPSGAAGGLVTRNPKYRMRRLEMRVLDKASAVKWDDDCLAVVVGRVDDTTLTHARAVPRGSRPRPAEGESIIEFRRALTQPSSWYNGYTYLDTMNREAVREFIRVTHETYRRRCGKHFGGRVPGIFTDEPNYFEDGYDSIRRVPWTDALPAVFKQRYGYDLLQHLPELFFDVDGETISRVRWNFYDCATELFVDAFARQIGEWCERNGLAHTGHVLAEETLAQQTHAVGNAMRFYEHMQAPGMDLLTESHRIYDVAKQVSSVARQFDRKWRLTETYGCTGWDFSLAGHKALGDWQVALGINLRCQHLAWYTMEGEAKRDYPACISYQSPWWESYRTVEDYFARILGVMTQGKEVRDLLVIHPIESAWTVFGTVGLHHPVITACQKGMGKVRDSLLEAHIDFDYGDEDILARHASISRAGGETTLKVSKATYRAVVVPPMVTIRSSTLALLKRFRRAGGVVVFAGPAAGHVDATESKKAANLAAECIQTPPSGDKLVGAVDPLCRQLSIADGEGKEIGQALYLLREDDEASYLFVCNTGHSNRQLRAPGMGRPEPRVVERTTAFEDVHIRGFAACGGSPIELDPFTGDTCAARARRSSRGWTIRTSLPALGSRLFVIPKKVTRKLAPRPLLKDVRHTQLKGAWDVVLTEDNVLALDRPRGRIAGGKWKAAEEILRTDREMRKAMEIPPRGGAMVQPWARRKAQNPRHVAVELEYAFQVDEVPSGALYLALEQPQRFTVHLNGTPVSTDTECGWWVDPSLRKIPLRPDQLRTGDNRIRLALEYDEEFPGLEIVYLLGTFGSKVKETCVSMTAAPRQLTVGDWVKQGLAFYSGSVGYCRTIQPCRQKNERVFVSVPAYRGAGVRVLVNGEEAGVVISQPNEVDITDLLTDGKDRVTIEVLGHRRNSHGPLHLHEKWPAWTGSGEFVSEGDRWTDNYQLVPCGLLSPPSLIIRK